MEEKRPRYKRLQVRRIWLRALLEIAAVMIAIVVCSAVVVSSYEHSFSEQTKRFTADNTAQLARSIAGLVERDMLTLTQPERSEYVAERYAEQLNDTFISEDFIYSGAFYKVSGDRWELFSQSDSYTKTLEDAKLIDDGGKYINALSQCIDSASVGKELSGTFDDVYMTFVPVFDNTSDMPYAIAVASVAYRDSISYAGDVRKRITYIAIISGILIITYYLVSAARSQKRTNRGEAVSAS